MNFNDIQNDLGHIWTNFQDKFQSALDSPITLIDDVNHYQYSNGGKRIRPMLLLLSAATIGNSSRCTSDLAVAVELLHNASLMHDDVVDDDLIRRGQPSIHCKWNTHVALLTGDYYLAKVMQLLLSVEDRMATETLSGTVISMTEGELIQQQFSTQPVLDTTTYCDIIHRKTATLMAACCKLGACGTEKDTQDWASKLFNFGIHYGMAFQLRDDLNDRSDSDNLPDQETIYKLLINEISAGIDALTLLPNNIFSNHLSNLIKQLQ